MSTKNGKESPSPTKRTRSRRSIRRGEDKLPSTPARDELTRKLKVAVISRALSADPVDTVTLRQLAISRGGLLSNDLRCKAWPKLLCVDIFSISPKPDQETLHAHRDYNQVVLDVNRSLKRFPPGMETDTRMAMQDQLVDIIMRVLVANEELHYYQGYHDIVVTILLVVGEDITFALMDKLSNNHLRDFMDPNMERTKHILNYLYPIVGRANPELKAFMEKSEVGTIFALSWLITWFGHVLKDLRHIVRLYDYFIACHPVMPIYLAAAIVLYREKDILATECEMCYVHSLLSKIPDDLPLEELATRAGDLFVQFPPEELAIEVELQSQINAALANSGAPGQEGDDVKSGGRLKDTRQNVRYSGHSSNQSESSAIVRVGWWTITAALSAAAVAVLSSATDWSWLWQ